MHVTLSRLFIMTIFRTNLIEACDFLCFKQWQIQGTGGPSPRWQQKAVFFACTIAKLQKSRSE